MADIKQERGLRAAADLAARGGMSDIPVDGLRPRIGLRLAAVLAEEQERGRFFLFLPVAAICGVLLFFAADRDPSLPAALVAAVAAAGLVYVCRTRPVGFPLSLAACALMGGFLSAGIRTELATAPVLERPIRAIAVGYVEAVEPRARGVRVVIAPEQLGELPPDRLPARIRVTVPKIDGLAAGSRVSVEALWRPPPGPVRPGGYDFARQAFFQRLGAVGSGAERPVILEARSSGASALVAARIDNLRNAISARILSVVDGNEGAIAAALVTGQRGEISNEANEALRVAGLYHVISISGLHMALFGGTLFAAVRFVLTLIPGVGLRYPVKKWAAGAALIGAGLYLALSGAEVAAQRSFIMIAVVFLAVIFDRQGVTMRNLALAALVTVLLMPEAVLGPSFQMSFCAVIAIVAWYEAVSARAPSEERATRHGAVRFVQVYFGGIIATTIAATFATAPFATFHFQRLAVHSLPGNLIALPVVGLLVMPWALAGIVLMPFGLDAVAWTIMGFGIGLMLDVARWIAAWPFATLAMPAYSGTAVLLMAGGFVWLSLFVTRLRWLGALPVLLGVLLAVSVDRADIYVESEGRAAAVRGPDGKLAVIGIRFASFAAGNWLSADGDLRKPREAAGEVRCDRFGCTAPLEGGGHLVLAWTYAALAEDCSRAAIVVTRLIAPPACRSQALVLDGADFAKEGAMTLVRQTDGSYAVHSSTGASHRIWQQRSKVPEGPRFAENPPQSAKTEGSALDLADESEAEADTDEPEPQ